MLGRGSWEGPEDSEPGWAGSSLVWTRRLWRLGPVGVSEAVLLRKRAGERGVRWWRFCFLDGRFSRSSFWRFLYLLASRRNRDREVSAEEARKRWRFLEEAVPEWRRDRRIRELGL